MGGNIRAQMKHRGHGSRTLAERELVAGDGGSVRVTLRLLPSAQGRIGCEYEIADSCRLLKVGECDTDLMSSIGLAFRFLPDELRVFDPDLRIADSKLHETGFERMHNDPDMSCLLMAQRQIEDGSNCLDTEALDPNPDGPVPEVVAENLSVVVRLRHRIRRRVVALAKVGDSGSPLLAESVPTVVRFTQGMNSAEPLTSKSLVRKDSGEDVKVEIWSPRRDDDDPKLCWVCEYRISGLDEPIHAATRGVDSMDALRWVFDAMELDLKASGIQVAVPAEGGGWATGAFEGTTGFERFGAWAEPDALLGHLVAVEVLRNRLLYAELRGGSKAEVNVHEDALLDHLRAAERLRLALRRRSWRSSGP